MARVEPASQEVITTKTGFFLWERIVLEFGDKIKKLETFNKNDYTINLFEMPSPNSFVVTISYEPQNKLCTITLIDGELSDAIDEYIHLCRIYDK